MLTRSYGKRVSISGRLVCFLQRVAATRNVDVIMVLSKQHSHNSHSFRLILPLTLALVGLLLNPYPSKAVGLLSVPVFMDADRKQSFDGRYAARACPEIGTSSQPLPHSNPLGDARLLERLLTTQKRKFVNCILLMRRRFYE